MEALSLGVYDAPLLQVKRKEIVSSIYLKIKQIVDMNFNLSLIKEGATVTFHFVEINRMFVN